MILKFSYKKFFLYFLLISVYRLTLDWIYKTVVSTFFTYQGFSWSPSIPFLALSWGTLFLLSYFMWPCYLNRENRLSYEILFILHLILLVPFTSMLFAGMFTISFWVCNTLYWAFLIHLCTHSQIKILNVTGSVKRIKKAYVPLSILLLSSVLYISARYTGFRMNFDLNKVYDLRSEAATYNYPVILSYIFSWSRMVIPILIGYFMRIGRKGLMFVCCGIQLLSFGIDGSKTTLFLMLFVIGINLLPPFSCGRFNKFLLCAFLCLDAFCVLWYLWKADVMPVSLFVRRLSFIPLQISGLFFDFFTTHSPDFFRQSFLRHFGFSSPYPTIAYMIAWEYSGTVSSANNGLISDAVANLGLTGIFVFPCLLTMVLKLLDKCAKGLDIRIFLSVALYVSVSLSNSFLFTVLLSHGLLVVMYLLVCFKRDNLMPLKNTLLQ